MSCRWIRNVARLALMGGALLTVSCGFGGDSSDDSLDAGPNLVINGPTNFGTVVSGEQTAYLTLTVTNTGTSAATSLSGNCDDFPVPDPFGFGPGTPIMDYAGGSFPGRGGTCGSSLAAGASCTIRIQTNSLDVGQNGPETICVGYGSSGGDSFSPMNGLPYVASVNVYATGVQAGASDSGFGNLQGAVSINPLGGSGTSASGRAVLLQSDGKIVAVGQSYDGASHKVSLVRLNPDGSLDSNFGNHGVVVQSLSTDQNYAYAAALQSDGKILVAGSQATGSGNSNVLLLRYNSDGSPDSSFGVGGVVSTVVGTASSIARGVAEQGDGKIVVAGYGAVGAKNDVILARYDSNGNLDTSYGSSGIVTTAIGSGDDRAYALAIQANDDAVVAGYTTGATYASFAVARYDTAGALDTAFGTSGVFTTNIAVADNKAYGIAIQPGTGSIFVVGQVFNSGNSSSDVGLIKLTSAGALDTSFGTGGKVQTALNSTFDAGYSVAPAPNGDVIVGGAQVSNSALSVVRYLPNGTADTNFYMLQQCGIAVCGIENGIVTDSSAGDSAFGVVIQPSNGEIVTVGGVNSMTVTRFWN